MKNVKVVSIVALLLVFALAFAACTATDNNPTPPGQGEVTSSANEPDPAPPANDDSDRPIKVGFAQTGNTHPWRITQTNDIKRVAEERGFDFVWVDAQEDTAKQVQNVEELINQGIDYLFFDPREYEGSHAALMVAKEAGIPTIVVDRQVRGEPGVDFITMIGSSFVFQGQLAGEWLRDQTGGETNIVQIQHIMGSSVDIDRTKGFAEIIDQEPGMTIVASQYGNSERDEGQKVMENILQSHQGQFDSIYSQSDESTVGVVMALKGVGLDPADFIIISTDGGKEAIQMILDGTIGATVTCSPFYGNILFDWLERIIAGETVPTEIIVDDFVIDSTNAAEEILRAY